MIVTLLIIVMVCYCCRISHSPASKMLNAQFVRHRIHGFQLRIFRVFMDTLFVECHLKNHMFCSRSCWRNSVCDRRDRRLLPVQFRINEGDCAVASACACATAHSHRAVFDRDALRNTELQGQCLCRLQLYYRRVHPSAGLWRIRHCVSHRICTS
jgi:hypothetical protein